jgi:glycerophosphoryl diester phosphodiesterase
MYSRMKYLKYPIEFPCTKVIAHRANCGEDPIPENTLAAIRIAHSRGIKWVECDVKLTADQVAIVIHDDTLKRTTDAQGSDAERLVSEMTYAEIVQYDAGIKYSPKFAGERVPRFIDFLLLLKKFNMGLMLEIKPIKGFEVETTRKIVEILNECNLQAYPKLLLQSFSIKSVEEVIALDPKLNTGLLIETWENPQDILNKLQCTALVAYHEILNEERVKVIKQETATPYLFSWTVNDAKKASELYSYGVDVIISDHPERIILSNNYLQLFSKNLTLFQGNEQKLFEPQQLQDSPRVGNLRPAAT